MSKLMLYDEIYRKYITFADNLRMKKRMTYTSLAEEIGVHRVTLTKVLKFEQAAHQRTFESILEWLEDNINKEDDIIKNAQENTKHFNLMSNNTGS
jgi:transcriptional regulator with XRE-family HTH domain